MGAVEGGLVAAVYGVVTGVGWAVVLALGGVGLHSEQAKIELRLGEK